VLSSATVSSQPIVPLPGQLATTWNSEGLDLIATGLGRRNAQPLPNKSSPQTPLATVNIFRGNSTTCAHLQPCPIRARG